MSQMNISNSSTSRNAISADQNPSPTTHEHTSEPTPPAEAQSKEVSCLALTFFYDYLGSKGIDKKVILQDLPYPVEHFQQQFKWIDFKTFQCIEERVDHLFPEEPDLFYHIGRSVGKTKGFGFLRVLIRAFTTPALVYRRFPKLVKRFLFPFVDIKVDSLSNKELHLHYNFDPNYPPSHHFLQTIRGILAGVPEAMGVPTADVVLIQHDETNVTFHLKIKSWPGPMQSVKGMFQKLTRPFQNRRDAYAELEKAHEVLTQTVQDLSLRQEISSAASTALEVDTLLNNITTAFSRELDRSTFCFLAEGKFEMGLRVMAQANATPEQRESLQPLIDPTHPLTHAIINDESKLLQEHALGWRVLPLRHSHQVLGAIFLEKQSDDDLDPALLQSIANNIAIALANALSYREITELKASLERRVTERTEALEHANQKLEETNNQLEQVDRAKQEFFTNVSHELKTPLTLIMAPLDEIESQLPPQANDKIKDDLRIIRNNAGDLKRMIEEILDFARIDRGKMPLKSQVFDLARFTQDLVLNLSPWADQKSLIFGYDGPKSNVGIEADPRLIRRVLSNLITNAIKYVDDEDRVTVHLFTKGDEVHIEVEDTGPGIPYEDQQFIFQRFHRARDADGRIVEGSGIGLAMARDIVEQHGGEIELESEPGQGCVFRLILPRLDDEVQHVDFKELSVEAMNIEQPGPWLEETEAIDEVSGFKEPPPEIEHAITQVAGHRLLLVEDNHEMRRFLTRMLESKYQVIVAKDGREGLALARKEQPDLILSDVMMPYITGYEMCRKLKSEATTHNIPVILLSARHGTQAALDAFDAQADDFVNKPFSPPELLARIQTQLELRALHLSMLRLEKQSTLGSMAMSIAHEVLNPVNAIVNATPALQQLMATHKEGALDDENQQLIEELVGVIDISGHRIHKVVQATLSVARQDRSDQLRLQAYSITEGFQGLMALLSHRMTTNINVHYNPEWEEEFLCYPSLVNQVLMNLFVNALDVLEDTGGDIFVNIFKTDDDKITIEVKDTGPGISPEDEKRIFAPFFTTKEFGRGTGLGLHISREIAEMHQGSLTLFHEQGSGAIFRFTIPLHTLPDTNIH